MILYSCYNSLKVMHSKGTAVFINGMYETQDKEIIKELLKDKNIICKKDIDDIAHNIKEKI